jgi:septum formation protein
MKLVLASTSPYRAALLKKSGVPFTAVRPAVNEDEIKSVLLKDGATPLGLAQALSQKKGESVWQQVKDPHTIVISGDQVASLNGTILGKPGNFENALDQLQKLSGHTHQLITALTVYGPSGFENHVSITELKMRILSETELRRYLLLDTPYDCAGSYKIEENGIALFESIVSDDFTAIQGIPMIWLCNKLKEYNCEFFQP